MEEGAVTCAHCTCGERDEIIADIARALDESAHEAHGLRRERDAALVALDEVTAALTDLATSTAADRIEVERLRAELAEVIERCAMVAQRRWDREAKSLRTSEEALASLAIADEIRELGPAEPEE